MKKYRFLISKKFRKLFLIIGILPTTQLWRDFRIFYYKSFFLCLNKKLLKLFIITLIINGCDLSVKELNFIEKMSSKEIELIRIYRYCESLQTGESNIAISAPCTFTINLSPERLITDFNKVDSINSKQEIIDYKNFLLKYSKQYQNNIKFKNNLDIRIVLLIEFENKSIDTLSFIEKNKIQVNESIILEYSNNIKAIFQNKYR